jgi:hypothetical protein
MFRQTSPELSRWQRAAKRLSHLLDADQIVVMKAHNDHDQIVTRGFIANA